MAPQKVTITIQSNFGEDGPLTVQDSLRQVIDLFELIFMAQGSGEGEAVSWILQTISKTSPLAATGEAVTSVPHVSVDEIASRAIASVAEALIALSKGETVPSWMDRDARNKARAFLLRNMNGLGRTDIQFSENAPIVSVNERAARIAIATLDRAELDEAVSERDLSRTEYGSIEGEIAEAVTHYGRPAIRIRERLTGAIVQCVLSQELAERIGQEHNWEEIWSGQRVLVVGEIFYRNDGLVSRVHVTDMQTIAPHPITIQDIADPNFTNGLTPAEHIARLWTGDDG